MQLAVRHFLQSETLHLQPQGEATLFSNTGPALKVEPQTLKEAKVEG